MKEAWKTIVKKTPLYTAYRYFTDRRRKQQVVRQFWAWTYADQKRSDFYQKFVAIDDSTTEQIKIVEDNEANPRPWKNLFDNIVVISLPSCSDRRRYIEQHLPSVGIHSFEFFDATSMENPAVALAYNSGQVKTYPPCFRCGKLDCGNPDCNNFLTPQQVATFITYMRLWRRIATGQYSRVLILEDDVRIHDHAEYALTWLIQQISDGLVPFQAGKPCLMRLGWALSADHTVTDHCVVNETIKMSNPCHAITREYAVLLLKRYAGIVHTVDVYQHLLTPMSREAFTLYPPIASELSWTEGVFASTIHPKSTHSRFLQSVGDTEGVVRNEQMIRRHIKKKYYCPLLIVGHPRCGTGYASTLCRQLGLDIGHEKLGADGMSSWMCAVDADENPYAGDAASRTRRALVWEYLVMPVRDLATAAGSVMRDSIHAPPSYTFRRDNILQRLDIDLEKFATSLERAVWSVTSWSRIILQQSPDLWFRIEDQHEVLRDFLIKKKLCNFIQRYRRLNTSPVNVNKAYRGKRYPKPTIDIMEWNSLSEGTRLEISWYCDTFGYKLPFSNTLNEE